MATLRQMSDTVLTASGLNQTAYRDEVRRIVSDVYRELSLNLRLNQKGVAVTLTGTVDYSLSSTDAVTGLGLIDFLSLRSVVYAGASNYTRTLERVTPDEILSRRSSNVVSSGAGWIYAHDPPDILMFYPAPQTGDVATIYYNARPEPLSDDAEEPLLVPSEFHYVIEDGALERALRYQKKPHGPADADRYRQRYRDGINSLRRWRNQGESALPRHVIVGRRYRAPSPRRDADWSGGL